MARQEIDLTTPQPNGKMGEPTKAAWEKVNDMTLEIYENIATNSTDIVDINTGLNRISGKNMLMNCSIPVNQRAFAGGALALGVFGYDRWKAGAGGCNVTINSATGVWTLTGPIQQVIENPQAAWGSPITISANSPSGPINVYLGGATGVIPAGTGRKSVTLTPSGSGNMLLEISTAAATTFSQLQAERGSVASSFDFRPIALELEMCKRYAIAGAILGRGNGVGAGQILLTHSMRAAPAITTSNVNYIFNCNGLTPSSSYAYAEFVVNTIATWAFGCSYLLDAEL